MVPSVEFNSHHSVRTARQIVREHLSDREPLLSTPEQRYVLGFVRDPDFELIAFGPASEGAAGPMRWRTPSKSRTLQGSIMEAGGGTARVVATFRGASVAQSRGRRRTEAWLTEWLRDLLDGTDGDGDSDLADAADVNRSATLPVPRTRDPDVRHPGDVNARRPPSAPGLIEGTGRVGPIGEPTPIAGSEGSDEA